MVRTSVPGRVDSNQVQIVQITMVVRVGLDKQVCDLVAWHKTHSHFPQEVLPHITLCKLTSILRCFALPLSMSKALLWLTNVFWRAWMPWTMGSKQWLVCITGYLWWQYMPLRDSTTHSHKPNLFANKGHITNIKHLLIFA